MLSSQEIMVQSIGLFSGQGKDLLRAGRKIM